MKQKPDTHTDSISNILDLSGCIPLTDKQIKTGIKNLTSPLFFLDITHAQYIEPRFIEYKFNNIPLAISADWNPKIQLISNAGLKVPNLGFTVRYIIK